MRPVEGGTGKVEEMKGKVKIPTKNASGGGEVNLASGKKECQGEVMEGTRGKQAQDGKTYYWESGNP